MEPVNILKMLNAVSDSQTDAQIPLEAGTAEPIDVEEAVETMIVDTLTPLFEASETMIGMIEKGADQFESLTSMVNDMDNGADQASTTPTGIDDSEWYAEAGETSIVDDIENGADQASTIPTGIDVHSEDIA